MPSDPAPNQTPPPSGKPRRRPTNPSMGGNWIWLLILCLGLMVIWSSMQGTRNTINWSEFVQLLKEDNLKEVIQNGDRYEGEIKDLSKITDPELKKKLGTSGKFSVERMQGNDLPIQQLLNDKATKGLVVYAKPTYSWLSPLLMLLLPAILILAFFLIFLPRIRDPLGGGFLNNYIKSPAKRYERSKLRVTFDDVAGMQNAKSELQEVVEFLRSPEKFQRLGAVVPKGVLLVGPPGTGKTLLARAVAGEAGVPFYSISGSEFIQMFVGVGASRVRDMFKTAKENAPCLTGDTVVTLSDGRQVTIQEMFEKGMVGVRVPAMTEDFRLEDATVTAITRKPCPDLYEITTPVGSIKATGNHLFPLLGDEGLIWVRADELKEGDHVAAPRHIPTREQASCDDFMPAETDVRFRDTPAVQRRPRLGIVTGIPAAGLLSAARRSLGMGEHSFQHGHVSACERGKVVPSRQSLQGVVEEMDAWREAQGLPETEEFTRLKALAHSDVIWARIQKVTQIAPVEHVYDLCLDRHHCFVANNLITHNCILFIDEIDAVGRMRGAGLGGGSDEREQTLNQILSEMDGFTPTEAVIVMAATNRPDVLDSALLRPGRFDRHITIDRPTWQGRLQILKVHTRNKPLADDVDLETIARGMIGMTGADLRNLANEAALLATREGKSKIDRSDFERAADRVLIGAKREEVLSLDEKRRTAYHEAGHALCAWLTPKADPIFKLTIIPRGRSLGMTRFRPDEDRMDYTMTQLRAQLIVAMGGRAADRLVYSEATSGANQDLKQATRIARLMVTQFGMSDRIGPVAYRIGEEHVFLGKEIQEPRDFGEGTANLIDDEVRRILREADEHAYNLLKSNRHLMDRLVEALLQKEELLREEIDDILKGDDNNGQVMTPETHPGPAEKIESRNGG